MRYFRVKNWQRFQHYKDRNPPWIKLHYELLTSSDWVTLSDASKLLAIVCMLIASRNEGNVPDDPNYLKRVAYLDKMPDLKPLIKCGFLENVLADDSCCYEAQANATTETETETETKRSRGSRFALQDPPSEWIMFCMTQRPELNAGIVFDSFRDYWVAQPGQKGVKTDWFATWRNWVRNQKSTQGGNYGKQKPKLELAAEGIAKSAAKRESASQGGARSAFDGLF